MTTPAPPRPEPSITQSESAQVWPPPSVDRSPSAWRTTPVAILASLVVLLAAGLIAALVTRPSVPAEPNNPAAQGSDDAASDAAEPEPEYGPLTASSVTLDLLIVSQQCFGSAGCNVEFEVEPVFGLFTDPVEPRSQWVVTYEVTGVEDQYVNSFTITVTESDQVGAGSYEIHGTYTTSGVSDRVSTPPAPVQLAATVTSVRER